MNERQYSNTVGMLEAEHWRSTGSDDGFRIVLKFRDGRALTGRPAAPGDRATQHGKLYIDGQEEPERFSPYDLADVTLPEKQP